MVSSCQSNSHGRESGVDGGQRTEQRTEELHYQGKQVDQPVGEVPSRSLIAKAYHNARYEVPEWQWDIVGDEIALHINCVFCNLLDKSHTLFMLLVLLPCHRSLKQPASVLQQ